MAQQTCSCELRHYRPTFTITYTQEKQFTCLNCRLSLSLRQVDDYTGSEAYQQRLAQIEEEHERRLKQGGNGGLLAWQEDIYDQVV